MHKDALARLIYAAHEAHAEQRAVRFHKNFDWTRLSGFAKRLVHGSGKFLGRPHPLERDPWR